MQIASGLDFSLAVESGSGRLFSFGDNSLGQLGRPAATASSQCAEDWLVRDAEGVPLLVDKAQLFSFQCLLAAKNQ
jgi:alpha-tubulin suppressor-like RCC1 family protein